MSDLVLHPRGTVLSLLDGELEVGDGGPEAMAAAKAAKLAKRQVCRCPDPNRKVTASPWGFAPPL